MTQAFWVIIPAAGVGQRMQASFPKQYLSLAGETILDRTIALFISHPLIAGVLVGVGQEDAYWQHSKWYNHELVKAFVGGEERSDTVQKGLRYLLGMPDVNEHQVVLVHDAARPLLSQDALNRIMNHQSEHGAILAMPAKDTVKLQLAEQPLVDATLDRSAIWLAQTPQKFPLLALLDSLERAQLEGVSITDECSAMEFIGWHPDLVIGESSNIKITLPEDLLIAEALYSYLSKLH
ncbi:MAG: 2-C-methyl-D-erythritol 4-phosphate cytidylyltransferase [Marinomonas foliarum]|jgi:2-C-methyl-D-erythritol 4-phosphate cytidylyltransferase|uniref:2-C-methyl-D-erythritol 4-phosphate cytidylyltransferase n=1 Tax=Marinomonas foliarum TaxID=491950 RepID=A0ABX7IU59_9GAMM|nr:2-C-methyl-D-erythritol 4-phosphate cytidylyltransferase [Marinomonas foliarum]QRV24794.1 2-C-methyl-D-erythritol 4-phosphate cytidylyltransferase [Marinomonas foliarum]